MLPLDIHKLIVDVVGDEFAAQGDVRISTARFASPRPQLGSQDPGRVLRSFSLVCKYWRTLALVHLFKNIFLFPPPPVGEPYFTHKKGRPSSYALLWRVLERNPSLGRCVKHLHLDLPIGPGLSLGEDHTLEKVCRILSPVTSLVIGGLTPPSDHPQALAAFAHHSMETVNTPLSARTSIVNGLRFLTHTTTLQHISIACRTFKTSMVEGGPNIRALDLPDVEDIVVDHQEEGTFLKSLEELKLGSAHNAMASLRTNPEVTLFRGIRTLQAKFNVSTLVLWDQTFVWENLTALHVDCIRTTCESLSFFLPFNH